LLALKQHKRKNTTVNLEKKPAIGQIFYILINLYV